LYFSLKDEYLAIDSDSSSGEKVKRTLSLDMSGAGMSYVRQVITYRSSNVSNSAVDKSY